MDQPPSRFVTVVGSIARSMALDEQTLISGRPVEMCGVRFAFIHFGHRDPEGLTLFAQVGSVPAGDDAIVFRRLLQLNAVTPAGLAGYYALVPGTDTLVCCWRIDIAGADDPAPEIAATVVEMCSAVGQMKKALDDEFRMVTP